MTLPLACIYFMIHTSVLYSFRLKVHFLVASSPGHMHLRCLPLWHPEPDPFIPTAATTTWIHCTLSSPALRGSSLLSSILFCLAECCDLLIFKANSVDMQQDPSPCLNIQINVFGMPHFWPPFYGFFIICYE